MNRILLFLLLLSACLSACTKSTNVKAVVAAQAVKDKALIVNYLSSQGLPQQHVDTSDVYYVIDTVGTGNDLYTSSTSVTLGYTARQLTANETLGPVFAQTDKFHPSYVLGAVLRGWQLGIPQCKKGGTITLFLPSRYAYGPFPQPGYNLPANAVLVFVITVYNITN